MNLQFMIIKVCCRKKTFSTHLTKVPPPYWPDPNGKSWAIGHSKSLYKFVVPVEAYPYAKKSPSWLNSVLTYCKFNIENYVWKAQVYLTTPIWTNWIKQMHLCMPNHIQKINFMPMFILINFIPRFILTCCFERLWARPTATTWNNWINLLLPLIPYHMQKD